MQRRKRPTYRNPHEKEFTSTGTRDCRQWPVGLSDWKIRLPGREAWPKSHGHTRWRNSDAAAQKRGEETDVHWLHAGQASQQCKSQVWQAVSVSSSRILQSQIHVGRQLFEEGKHFLINTQVHRRCNISIANEVSALENVFTKKYFNSVRKARSDWLLWNRSTHDNKWKRGRSYALSIPHIFAFHTWAAYQIQYQWSINVK